MQISEVKIILIHGNDTMRWSHAWLPWAKQELEKLELNVVAETFPDSILARKQYWLRFLKEYLHADENTIIIGHSSGAVAAMRFAEENKLLGSILISPCYTDLGIEAEKQSGYFDGPWDWKTIKKTQKWIVQFASKDDPFIPVGEFQRIHKKLETEYHEFENRGHFNVQDAFPEIIEVIKRKLNL